MAQLIIDRLDPAVRLAAARMQAGEDSPGRCQQVWCPVCALAALVSGEQHPLLSVVAEHSVALLALVKALVENMDDPGGPQGPDGGPQGPDGGQPPDPSPPQPDGSGEAPGRYQPIPVIVED
ncbi:hypothetical protein [Mycobacterium sp. SMC-4]|uniref:hypothetical protein n=1 Tax=Mycobacterium sp. SMC-4 TaxID=2857059 RepID=UPI0021B17C7F|nr:hypothetical protein [Mycobacterium sp. SMC-4]UXA16243.1 hypothetical protein KXD98_15500 [Mycobacterium sp. SMC-4]